MFYWTDVVKSMCLRNKTVFSCSGFMCMSFDVERTVKYLQGDSCRFGVW